MTRTLDPVWNHFKKSAEGKTDQAGTKQHYIATCNFCDTIMTGQPKRMKIHLNKIVQMYQLKLKINIKIKTKNKNLLILMMIIQMIILKIMLVMKKKKLILQLHVHFMLAEFH